MTDFPWPADWPRSLKDMADGLVTYGRTCDEETIPALAEQYRRVVVETTDAQREALLCMLIDAVEHRALSGNALNPFLMIDPSVRLSSTAALHFVAVWPELRDDDPLAGVRWVAEQAGTLSAAGDVARAAGFLTAMVQIGDKRILDVLGPCWRCLPPEGRAWLTGIDMSHPKAAVLWWCLDWLEDCEGDEFGAVAGMLVRAARSAEERGVIDIHRALPIYDALPDRVITITRRWSKQEFAALMEERLLHLARLESEPRVLPDLMRTWGMSVPADLVEGAYTGQQSVREPSEPDLADLYDSGPVGLVGGRRIARLETLWARSAQAYLTWGYFNPYGPTVAIVGTMRGTEGGRVWLWFGMLNPFKVIFRVFGTCANPTMVGWASAHDVIQQAFAENDIVDRDGTSWPILAAPPGFVASKDEFMHQHFARTLFTSSQAVLASDLRDTLALLQEYPNPWDRAGVVRDRALGVAPESERLSQDEAAERVMSSELADAWWEAVTDPIHVVREAYHLPDAWDGAIEFQREIGSGLATAAGRAAMLDVVEGLGVTLFRDVQQLSARLRQSEGDDASDDRS